MALIALMVLLRVVNPSLGLYRQMTEMQMANGHSSVVKLASSHVPLWALPQGNAPATPATRIRLIPPREIEVALTHGRGFDLAAGLVAPYSPLRI